MRKKVLVLFTRQDDDVIYEETVDQVNSEIITFDNLTKVIIIQGMKALNTIARNSCRWVFSIYFSMLLWVEFTSLGLDVSN